MARRRSAEGKTRKRGGGTEGGRTESERRVRTEALPPRRRTRLKAGLKTRLTTGLKTGLKLGTGGWGGGWTRLGDGAPRAKLG